MSSTPSDFSSLSDLPAYVRKLDPLNQAAYRQLKLTGEHPIQDYRPLFQLAAWGLDHGVEMPNPRLRQSFREWVDTLLNYDNQDTAQNFLLTNPDDPEQPMLTLAQIQDAPDPLSASQSILQAIHLRLIADPILHYSESVPE